jgi:hypothetical protein
VIKEVLRQIRLRKWSPASRAILAEGEVLGVLIQTKKRNKASARPDEAPRRMADWPLNERMIAWDMQTGSSANITMRKISYGMLGVPDDGSSERQQWR